MSWLDLEAEIAAEFAELEHVDVRQLGMRIFREDGTRWRRWYEANRPHALAYASAYARAHRPEINEAKRTAYHADVVTARAKRKEYDTRTRVPRLKKRRSGYRQNPEAVLKPQRDTYRAGKGAVRQEVRKTRASGKLCAWAPCAQPVPLPPRGVIPEFCGRRCRDAATRAGQWKGRPKKRLPSR